MTRRTDQPVRDRASDLLDRVEEVRGRAPEVIADLTDRAHDLEGEARQRAEELRPVIRRSEIRAWTVVRALAGILMVVPRVVVRLLAAVRDVADDAAERGAELAERGREVADAIPAARSTRRRRRARTVLWVAGGFATGFVTGWLVAQRQAEADEVAYGQAPLDPDVELDSPNGSPSRRAAVPD